MTQIKAPFYIPLLTVWLGHFLVDLMIGIWPVYKSIANLDLAVAGLIGGTCACIGEGTQLIFGFLSDRGYRKALIILGLILTTTSTFFMYSESYYLLFFLCLCTCIGSASFHPSAVSLVSDLPTQKKSLLVSFFTSGGAIGMAFSQLIFIQSNHWFNGQIILLAIPAFILACYAGMNRLERTEEVSTPASHKFNFKILFGFFKRRDLLALYFTQLCNATLLWGTMFLLPDMLKTRGYDPWISFGGGHMAFVLGSASMMLPAGYLADRYSSKIVILSATAMSMSLFYTLFFIPDLTLPFLMTLLFFLGASLGLVNPVAVALGTKLVPKHKGMVSAFLMGLVWCVSEGVGQCGGGLLTYCFIEDAPAKALAVLGFLYFIGFSMGSLLPSEVEESAEIEFA